MGADEAPDPKRRRGGRPLDVSRDQAIRDAALSCLGEVGYERLTMDLVAARAHAGKGALYRRWPSKAALVIDAVACAKPELTFVPTASLRDDLDAYVAMAPERSEAPDQALMVALINAAAHDREFAGLLHDQFLRPRQQVLRDIIGRAQERGEAKPDLDVDLIVDLLPALFISRGLLGADETDRRTDRQLVRRIVDHVMEPLIRCPPL